MGSQKLIALLFAVVSLFAGAADASPPPKYLDIEQAVVNFTALHPGQKAVAAVVVNIHDGYHAQSHTPSDDNYVAFTAKIDPIPEVTALPAVYPPGKVESYKNIDPKSPLNVYTGTVIIYVPIEVKENTPPGVLKITGNIHLQACDDNLCFQPTSVDFAIDTKVVESSQPVELQNAEIFANYNRKPPTTTPAVEAAAVAPLPPILLSSFYTSADLKKAIHQAVTHGKGSGLQGSDWSFSYAFGAAFLAGLLFNIMPCVLPVLPIKAMGFYEVGQHKRSKSFMLGVIFSLGIIAVFAVLALLVLVLGTITWGSLFSKPWFIWPMVVVLVVMAFGLFGAFTFSLPVGAYRFEPRHDTNSGNFLLGALTAILATPCTAPLLPPLLVWTASQKAYIGVPAMLMVGVGMASPYLILSALPELARKFPRTGPWSELFKQMMGFMLLASAAYFGGGQLFDSGSFWWIVVAVIAIAALYLMGRTVQISQNATPVGVSATLAVLMVAGSIWWTAKVTGLGMTTGGAIGSFQTYSPELAATLHKQNKIVLIKFTAKWCATCQLIEATVYQDPSVWEDLKANNVVALKADFSQENPVAETLLKTLNPGGGIPLTAIYPAP
jgi:thiol:disulfide interchange protein DsbD